MRRLLMLALLVSVGLNVGLALRLREAPAPADRAWRDRAGRLMPAPGDSQAWHDRMDRRFRRLDRMLDLDPAQQEAFRAHRAGVAEDLRTLTAALEDRRALLRAEAARRPPDPAAVAAAVAAVGRAEARLDSLVAVHLEAELRLLRPAQQEHLLRTLPLQRLGGPEGRHHGRGHGRRGHGRQGGAGPPGGPAEGPPGE